GWKPDEYAITPGFITEPNRMTAFLPPKRHTTVFITVYDQWGDEKANRLRRMGYSVEILWRRKISERVISGTEVRNLMRSGKVWQHWVPGGVTTQLTRVGLITSKGKLKSSKKQSKRTAATHNDVL